MEMLPAAALTINLGIVKAETLLGPFVIKQPTRRRDKFDEILGIDHTYPPDWDAWLQLVHPEDRQALELASGVRWEELTSTTEQDVDFLLATYEVGGASTPDETLMRHHGREYGYVISGSLGIQIGFDEYRLEAGDSIEVIQRA